MSITKPMTPAESRTLAKIGFNIAYYRKLASLSQEQLAEKASVSANTISILEAATKFINPTTLTMIRIAGALDIPLCYLYEFKPDAERGK